MFSKVGNLENADGAFVLKFLPAPSRDAAAPRSIHGVTISCFSFRNAEHVKRCQRAVA